MSGFICSADAALKERASRPKVDELLSFGVKYLDDAMRGIFPDDLVLLGAPSGVGKTQLCVNIAIKNIEAGKRVHFIALEASEYEIEQRLKYQIIADCFFKDPDRPTLKRGLCFPGWLLGDYGDALDKYEQYANDFCATAFRKLFTFYKSEKFDVADLIWSFTDIEEETDLVIIDHIHYFDWEIDNDNRAIKEIAKSVRSLALDSRVPIVLVAHLRKKDRNNKELAPGIDEFHGSSDLTKIATKVITVAPGPSLDEGRFLTYFRIPKNRIDGGVSRFIGACAFDPKLGGYADEYGIGNSAGEVFRQIDVTKYPRWGRYFDAGSNWNLNDSGSSGTVRKIERYKTAPKGIFNPSQRD